MSVSLAPTFGVGYQSFGVTGLPNYGGFIYTYAAGTTTPQATYTSSSGATPNSQPIQLDSSGRPPQEIWLTDGLSYKFVLTDALGIPIPNGTYDNISGGITSAALAASSGSSLIGFTAAGATPTTVTVQQAIRDGYYNIRYKGAVVDGVTNDYAALVAADAACAALGKALYIPSPGIYIGANTYTPSAGLRIVCENRTNTYIKTGSATLDVISLTNTYNSLENVQIQSTVPRTAGAFIKVTGGSCVLREIIMAGAFKGIELGAACSNVEMQKIDMTNMVQTNGIGINVLGGTLINMRDVNVIGSAGAEYFAGINILNCGDITMYGCQFIHALSNMYIAPGNGQVVVSVKSDTCWYDQGLNGNVSILPTGTGAVNRVAFNGGWASGGTPITTNNVVVVATGSAVVDGLSINDMDIYGGVNGINMDGVGIKNAMISRNKIAGNSGTGISVNNVTLGALIAENRVGTSGGYGVNGVGVALTGTTDNALIVGNDLRLNTAILTNTASGTKNLIRSNQGYNPVGTVAITVTASPFTYTAGSTDETVYINGGTVSLVTVDGIVSFQQTNCTVRLNPKKSVVVTYTVAPGMAKTID